MIPLTYYRWAHAVNSRVLLRTIEAAIQAAATLECTTHECINAIEADVIWSDTKHVAVMGHPPATDSDLRFEDFLRVVFKLATLCLSGTTATPLIVKCDFKCPRAFAASVPLLEPFLAQYPFPQSIFLNADILPGPANSNHVAFDATTFVQQVHDLRAYEGGRHGHKLVLSVGWTTANATHKERERAYSPAMVDAMLRVLAPHGHQLSVTFAIRATSVRTSWRALRRLLEAPNHGFTLWWAATEIPDEELEWLYTTLEREGHDGDGTRRPRTYANRTYYDIKGFDRFLEKRIEGRRCPPQRGMATLEEYGIERERATF
ncbi:hypothetical protein PsorP6_016453 [Peronosclerospora sorghi]|uniref:Uncharacterized protein n=1 Tax=Peronosclerospora sorghi TaxID=230839 RepID=A0ACC0VN33_9STRA|nr:hypothetical protein PsorP6_016453 [Peronosclerospora sorghi]